MRNSKTLIIVNDTIMSKKPWILKKIIKARIKFATAHLNWFIDHWGQVF